MILSFFKRAVSLGDNDSRQKEVRAEERKEPTAAVADDKLRDTVYGRVPDNPKKRTAPADPDLGAISKILCYLIRTIKDPEKPSTLEDLLVVYEEGIKVLPNHNSNGTPFLVIEFNPTVPHCSLATLIGLCIRIKLERSIPHPLKLDIYIKKGAHDTEDEINKQINDKERIAAAMENPSLRELVEGCITEDE